MKRQAILAIALALSGAILFFSCRKNTADVSNEKASQVTDMISVQEAGAWFNHQQGPLSNGRVAGDTTIRIGDPVWNRSSNVDLGNGESILKVVLEHYWIVNGYRDLLFRKEQDGQIRSVVLEVHPDSAYLAKKHQQKGHGELGIRYFVDTEDFTGMLLLYNIKGRFIKGRQYVDGQLKYELLPKRSSTITAVSSTMHARVENDDDGGITLPEVVITAPAPTPPPPPIWIFPPSVPSGPINPPTNPFPFGGGGGGGGTSFNGVSAQQALANELDKDPNKLIKCATIAAYIKLGSFKITNQVVLQKLYNLNSNDKDFSVQDIQNGSGTTVNMDLFAVTVKSLPTINGVQSTPEQFLQYIRTNINDFTKDEPFSPYKSGGVDDTNLWNSANPISALVHIEIGMGPLGNDGTVIVSESAPDHWIFTTVKSPLDGTHPVSGNRRFGVYKNSDGSYLIYTKGVDRLTDKITGDWVQRASGIPFSNADKLWESFQEKVTGFVNSHGGNATDKLTVKARPDWDLVGKVLTGQESIDKLKENGGCE